jgi:hypothetical protein
MSCVMSDHYEEGNKSTRHQRPTDSGTIAAR